MPRLLVIICKGIRQKWEKNLLLPPHYSSIAQCNCYAREGYEFLSNQEKNLSPRLETVAVLEALGIHCAPVQSSPLTQESHLSF